MKHIVLGSVAIFATALLSPHDAQAQGTLYLSSLNAVSSGSMAAASDSWLAVPFGVGSNPGGYTLNSVQLGMADASGNPSGFAVMLYADAGYASGAVPGSSLGSLTGSASPSTAGVYIYAPAQSLTLSPRATYFVVMTAATPLASGAYGWSASAGGYSYSPGWGEGGAFFRSANGTSGWSLALPIPGIGQLAIYATAVPEPAAFSLAVLGGLLLLMRHRR